MTQRLGWSHLNRLFHGLSHLKFAFYLGGFYYQLRAMVFGPREAFVQDFCFALLLYGFAMGLEGLRDSDRAAVLRRKSMARRVRLFQWGIAWAIVMFSFAALLGLYMLFVARDEFQGVAIVSFGLGGLALTRQEYDCLNQARALPDEAPAEAPAEVPVTAGAPPPATD